MQANDKRFLLGPSDTLLPRHIGPTDDDIAAMLASLGVRSLDELVDAVVPPDIRLSKPLTLPDHRSESDVMAELRRLASENQVYRSLIGMGYADCLTPAVIQRNILDNPGWYTAYTPYQAEIAQGRLEALINFQTMVSDLTGLPLANASLLDEATAAAEAMVMCRTLAGKEGREPRHGFFVAEDCHPQTLAVLRTRAEAVGIKVCVGAPEEIDAAAQDLFGVLLQYPATDGAVRDHHALAQRIRSGGAYLVVATDLLALTLVKPPGEWGADVAVGSSQRFGVPMGFGGPHAAFLATKDAYKRAVPGRIIGVSRDSRGKPAYRLALQTREQHIRRDKATSNICTAQVLLAIIAGLYAVYHGPGGLRRIAERVHALAVILAEGLMRLGFDIDKSPRFDQVRILRGPHGRSLESVLERARSRRFNLRRFDDGSLGIALDEVSTKEEVQALWEIFADGRPLSCSVESLAESISTGFPAAVTRTSSYLTHEVFNAFHAEHELLRYMHRLQARDLSLVHSMIPLGSCTMKLNATAEMTPITWPEFSRLHPFVPEEQARGYHRLCGQLESWLADITGFQAVSLQPNAGSQGEYAGLLIIRAYHRHRGEGHRNVCLIPTSAHGTNPASAAMAGLQVVAVASDERGNVDLADLEAKARQHRERLAALMITYPSTHGVFEEGIRRICDIVHAHGGQVYMDGANMNALVGLARPGDFGADVCHVNLHKTFCIPHGGGGPGMGPIGVAAHLAPFLPGRPVREGARADASVAIGPVAAAPYGSAGITPIPWVYIALMGRDGLTKATQVAILNANYMAKRLESSYPVLYTGTLVLPPREGTIAMHHVVAHEFILDLRQFKHSAGIEAEDVAKRLMDYGFHAPTMSFPVPGTLMVEPTESESKAELDRFCEAMIAIREEIRAIEEGRQPRDNNVLKHAPHPADVVAGTEWNRPYPREQAAFPLPWVRERKFWPSVCRIDNAYGDRNLFCTCVPIEGVDSSPDGATSRA